MGQQTVREGVLTCAVPGLGSFAGLLPKHSCFGSGLREWKPPYSVVLPVAIRLDRLLSEPVKATKADSHMRCGRLLLNLRWQ